MQLGLAEHPHRRRHQCHRGWGRTWLALWGAPSIVVVIPVVVVGVACGPHWRGVPQWQRRGCGRGDALLVARVGRVPRKVLHRHLLCGGGVVRHHRTCHYTTCSVVQEALPLLSAE